MNHAPLLFLYRHLWTLLLNLNLLHTRFGQYIERAYLRAALPTVRAFEIEMLPATGLDVPEDELVECGPAVWLDQSDNGNHLVESRAWPVVFNESEGAYRFADGSVDGEAAATLATLESRSRQYRYDCQGDGAVCQNCHKPEAKDGAKLCKSCVLDELQGRRGA
jgi:hypothetical protein